MLKDLVSLNEKGLFIRLVEEKISAEYDKDLIQSPVHLSIGQEAVAVGLCKAMEAEDALFINYRGHAFYLAREGDLLAFFAELAGRQIGVSKGKAGSMHLSCPEKKIIGASAVVNSSLSNAVGYALAEKLGEKETITTVVIGDGATEQGSFHESLNFSALAKIPMLIVCENNGLAVHSPLKERQVYDLRRLPENYGLDCFYLENALEARDVCKVIESARDAVKKSKLPVFVTIDTVRYYEHVGPNEDFNAGYRSEDNILKRKAIDPIEKLRKKSPEVVQSMQKYIDEVFEIAIKSEPSSENELLTDVY